MVFVEWMEEELKRANRSMRRALYSATLDEKEWELACTSHGFGAPDEEDREWYRETEEIGKRLRAAPEYPDLGEWEFKRK